MCIAVPVKIVALLNETDSIVVVEGRHGREEANAALVIDVGEDRAGLLGRWVVVHAGFVLSLMDEAEARSRLSVFAAMDGLVVDDDALRPDEGMDAGGRGQTHV